LYFYELHESDDELFSDALLAHAEDFTENEFLDLVMEARAKVVDRFEEDTLVAAVARELERTHEFIYIDDRHLRAAVNVSAAEEDTVLAEIDDRDEDDEYDENDESSDEDDPFRTLLVRVDRPDLN
jgi:hypothetical protein